MSRYTIGPGTIYTEVDFPNAPLRVFVTEIDLNDENNTVEHYQYDMPSSRATVMAQSKENWQLNKRRVLSAVNHDFFDYGSGRPIGSNTRNGEVVYGDGYNVSTLGVTSGKNAGVYKANIRTEAVFNGGQKRIVIDQTNLRYYTNNTMTDNFSCILFNRFYDYPNFENTTNLTGTFVEVEPQGEWNVNGTATSCKIVKISDSKIPLYGSLAGGNLKDRVNYMLVFRGAKQTDFKNIGAKEGDIIEIQSTYYSTAWGSPLKNVKQGFQGFPAIMIQGVYNVRENSGNGIVVDHLVNKEPRTVCGVSKDGKKLFMVVIDGRSKISRGVTTEELGSYMLTIGAWDVVNFDGGGSSEMVIRSGLSQNDLKIANVPSDGSERKVMNTMQFISLAPEDEIITGYAYSKPTVQVKVGQRNLLPSIYGFNKYGEVVNKQMKASDFTYTCVPESFGTVTDGVLTPTGNQVYGLVYAKRGTQSILIKVKAE